MLSYKPATAFKVNSGIGLTYMLNTELGVTLYSDFQYAKPKFRYNVTEDPTDPNSTITTITEKDKWIIFQQD